VILTYGKKPNKKEDPLLWVMLKKNILHGNYFFSRHAKKRQQDRDVSELDVLFILENVSGRSKRNKNKDVFINGRQDWNYCIEGEDVDGNAIRVIVSFETEMMIVITVICIDDMELKNEEKNTQNISL